jgi:SAM-dependent methyltransferase
MAEWFEEWFGEEYLQLYPHRDDAEAARAVELLVEATGCSRTGGCWTWPAGPAGTRAPFARAGARCVGVDLSATLLRIARGVTDAFLVRADMRALPIRTGSMDLTVNLFTSFGYFGRESDHATALQEMVATVRPGGWFAIDFLNSRHGARPSGAMRARRGGGREVEVTRVLSPDGHHVSKTIRTEGRSFVERVRLFEPEEIEAMLRRTGIAVRRRFGDYDASPMQPGSLRTILVGQTA